MQPEQKPVVADSTTPDTVTLPPSPAPQPIMSVTPAPPLAPMAPLPEPKKSNSLFKTLLAIAGVITLLVLAFVAGAFIRKSPAAPVSNNTVDLPDEATVTAECVAGRGKQYISPKDIPMGPIYDVDMGKVVAVEYLVGQKELSEQSDMFANLDLPKVKYDHISIVPTAPHAGLDESHFHVIAYLISKDQAALIKCNSAGSSEMNMNTEQQGH